MRRMVFLVATCFLLGTVAIEAQQPASDANGDRLNPQMRRLHEQIYKTEAKKRLDSLKTDTDRLAELSQELKRSVDNVNPDATLSVDVIKKADEIAKLAKQVSEKMKGQ